MASLNNVYELEKITGNSEGQAMAHHSSTLAWKIPWMEEPDGLPSMGSHRVRQGLKRLSSSNLAAVKDRETWYAAIHGVTKGQTQLSD